MTEEEKARAAIARMQAEASDALSRAQSAEERATKAEQAIAEQRAAMAKLTEQFEAQRLAAAESAAGTVRELDFYVARADELERTMDPRSYAGKRGEGAVVRMVGAQVRSPDGGTVWRPGLLDDVQARSKEQIELQRAHLQWRMVRGVMGHSTPIADAAFADAARACGEAVERGIFAGSAGIGLEWAPINYAPELERRIGATVGLRSVLMQRVVAPGRSTSVPQMTSEPQFYDESVPTMSDPAGVPVSSFATAERQIVTKAIAARLQAAREAIEDSALAWAVEAQDSLVRAWAFQTEDSIVNGDTAGTHQDAIASWNARGRLAGLNAALDHRRRFLGLRATAFDVGGARTPDQGSVQSYAGISALLSLIGPDAMIPTELQGSRSVVVAVSWEVYQVLLGLSEFQTWEKVGPNASILTGFLGNLAAGGVPMPNMVGLLRGTIPVLVTDAITADLASTGLYTGSGAKSGVLVFDRSRFEFVQKSGTEVVFTDNPNNDTRTLIMRNRQADIVRKFPSETAPVAFGRNWL